MAEDRQSQITVLMEEKNQRDSVINELTQQMQQLRSEFTTQRANLEGKLQATLQEAEIVDQLQQEL